MTKRKRRSVGDAAAAILAGACALAGPPIARAGETKIPFTGGLETLVVNKYVWRGILVTEDGVAQPSLTLGAYGFSANVWGNLDLTDYGRDAGYGNHRGEFSEVDFTLRYGYTLGPASLNAGVIAYTFPNQALDTTHEVFGAVGLDVPLSPTLTVYYDFDEADGLYATAGVGHRIPILEDPLPVSVDVSATVGLGSSAFNEHYFGPEAGALNDLALTVSLPVEVTSFLTVSPMVGLTSILHRSLRRAVRQPDNFLFGLSAGVGF